MNHIRAALVLAAAILSLQAHAYTATLSSGPTSHEAGVVTHTFDEPAPFFDVRGGTVYDSADAGMALTGDGIFLRAGVSAQPQKGAVSADDAWFSVGKGETAVFTFDEAVDYVGFLWGSVDTHNVVSFYDGTTLLARFTGGGAGLAHNQVPRGNGDQSVAQYLNFSADRITSMTVHSGGWSFELDNVSVRVADAADAGAGTLVPDATPVPPPVPEPGTYALLAAGLAAMGFVASRRRALRPA